jgi:hypothetical protein
MPSRSNGDGGNEKVDGDGNNNNNNQCRRCSDIASPKKCGSWGGA